MIKIEIATAAMKIRRIVENVKEIDWNQIKQKSKVLAGKARDAVRENRMIMKNKKIIIAAVLALALIIVCGAFFLYGGGSSKNQNDPAADLNETLSDNKADIQKSAQDSKNSDNSWIASIDIAGILSSLSKGRVEEIYTNRTIKVPLEFASIQKAIDAAKSGDTVLVSAGQYNENIIMKDGVSVVGEKADNTILDGQKKGSVVVFKDIQNKDTRLENFTIKNSGENLSGVLIENSSPIINRNIILQNDYDVYIKGESSPIVQRNVLRESKAGVQVFNLDQPKNSNPVIIDNIITANKKGMNIYKGGAIIDHNTISYNSSLADNGATFGIYMTSGRADIRNNIITDNGVCEICSGIYADAESNGVTISYNDLWNNQSNFVCFGTCDMQDNNFSEDPLFTSGIQSDFSLKGESPFLNSGSDGQKLGARL